MSNRKPSDYSIDDMGVDHPQYFQGAGTAFTNWEECFVGVGNTPYEALEEALDNAACNEWDVETIPNNLSDESDISEPEENEDEGEEPSELQHYVALYLR